MNIRIYYFSDILNRMMGQQLPMGMPPLALPPRMALPPPHRWRKYVVPGFHVGDEIAFEDLVPGESYFRKYVFGLYANVDDNYDEIILVDKVRNNQGNLTGEYSYKNPIPMQYYETFTGEPMTPIAIPQAPPIPGTPSPFDQIHMDFYMPGRTRFYKVGAVQRGRHWMAKPLKEKLKKNIKRKHLNTVLDRIGFSTNLGTGPANLIRKYLDLQPPKGTRRVYPPVRPNPHPYNLALEQAPLPYGPSEENFAGGKRKQKKRKTRKQKRT